MSTPARSIPVPLSVDAEYRLAVGPAVLPLRSFVLAGVVSPVAYVLIGAGLPGLWGLVLAGLLLAVAAAFGLPERQGVWLGTHLLYRHAWRVLPCAIDQGSTGRARVRRHGTAMEAEGRGDGPGWRRWRAVAPIPAAATVAPGILRLAPGGHRAVVRLDVPAVSVGADAYTAWCGAVIGWLGVLDCPAQFVTAMTHHDAARAAAGFDRRVDGWPATPLRQVERELATAVAEGTLGLRHHVVLAPESAGADGVPDRATLWRRRHARDASESLAVRVLDSALRAAAAMGLSANVADRDDLAALLVQTPLGAANAVAGDGALLVGGRHLAILTATRLPATIEAGAVVDAMLRARSPGVVSLHLAPVATAVAQRQLHRRQSMLVHAGRRGAGTVEAAVALGDTTAAVAALAHREISAWRVALTAAVAAPEPVACAQAGERFGTALAAHGFTVTETDGPGFLPAMAVAPGCPPLARSLMLTSDGVAARILPCLGTSFSDVDAPLVGINVQNGTPAYLSVWSGLNHNLVVVGSSGAGKSMAAKTLLVRHVMEGATAVVIDPDSEYGMVMRAVGGRWIELGDEAINPLGPAGAAAPDVAAGLVLPVLSVMAGDDRGIREGRPVRRLPDEDQGWLHGAVMAFLDAFGGGRVPVLSDLVAHLDGPASAGAATERERERCRVIAARLRRFTQGRRAAVFDRPSSFAVDQRPVAIGLRRFAMSYGADLTPALAVILTAVLETLARQRGRMLVVVDEAHRVTADPDAGEVLGQLVRQARKHGAGVWMLSQRVEDFVRTDLGRTLAATAASKLVLGVEEAVLAEARDVFRLSDEEAAALCPSRRGRGVLISGAERAIVDVVPGPALLAIADTRAPAARLVPTGAAR